MIRQGDRRQRQAERRDVVDVTRGILQQQWRRKEEEEEGNDK